MGPAYVPGRNGTVTPRTTVLPQYLRRGVRRDALREVEEVLSLILGHESFSFIWEMVVVRILVALLYYN